MTGHGGGRPSKGDHPFEPPELYERKRRRFELEDWCWAAIITLVFVVAFYAFRSLL